MPNRRLNSDVCNLSFKKLLQIRLRKLDPRRRQNHTHHPQKAGESKIIRTKKKSTILLICLGVHKSLAIKKN